MIPSFLFVPVKNFLAGTLISHKEDMSYPVAMLRAVIIIAISLLISCETRREERPALPSSVIEDTDMTITFTFSESYYAELERKDGKYYISIPELLIMQKEIWSYEKEDGIFLSDTALRMNIVIYSDLLFFSLGSYYDYIPYREKGKTGGDYYPML